jgi:hypothetical protein
MHINLLDLPFFFSDVTVFGAIDRRLVVCVDGQVDFNIKGGVRVVTAISRGGARLY